MIFSHRLCVFFRAPAVGYLLGGQFLRLYVDFDRLDTWVPPYRCGLTQFTLLSSSFYDERGRFFVCFSWQKFSRHNVVVVFPFVDGRWRKAVRAGWAPGGSASWPWAWWRYPSVCRCFYSHPYSRGHRSTKRAGKTKRTATSSWKRKVHCWDSLDGSAISPKPWNYCWSTKRKHYLWTIDISI